MEKQFTSTVYIIQDNKVLLIHHRKFNKWMPPGGHVNPDETPPECARREAYEETGLHIELIKEENVWINQWNASSFERPYMCLLEQVPEQNGKPAHQHVDLMYIAKPVGGSETHNSVETHDLRWFSLQEIGALIPDDEIFVETIETIQHLLEKFKKS
jgi:8-oxo-dGTP pyrophosphatase MutT (NUDIX family)